MKYCIKRTFTLPDTLEETKKVLARYYKDIHWFEEDIEEVLEKIKTWKDMDSHFYEFDQDELNELEEYFEVEYSWGMEPKIVEKE